MADPMRIRAQAAGDKATVRVPDEPRDGVWTAQRRGRQGRSRLAYPGSGSQTEWQVRDDRRMGCGSFQEPVPSIQRQGCQGWRQDRSDPGKTTKATPGPTKPRCPDACGPKKKGWRTSPFFLSRIDFITTRGKHDAASIHFSAHCGLPAGECCLGTENRRQNIHPGHRGIPRHAGQDGNPADLFEAKGEDLWKQKRGPKAASLEQVRPGQGAWGHQGRVSSSCRATSPTPVKKVQDLEIAHRANLHGDAAGPRCRSRFRERRRSGKGEHGQHDGAGHLGSRRRIQGHGSSTCRRCTRRKSDVAYEVGKRLFFQRGWRA
jgi:hypothetical protein